MIDSIFELEILVFLANEFVKLFFLVKIVVKFYVAWTQKKTQHFVLKAVLESVWVSNRDPGASPSTPASRLRKTSISDYY